MSEPRDRAEDLRFLVRRVQTGDEAAFEVLAGQVRPRVYRWALVQTGDPDDAEDATQEALVRLYLGIPRFRADSRFETWLFAVVRSAAMAVVRRRERRRDTMDRYTTLAANAVSTESADPLRQMRVEEAARLVRAFLRDLPQRQRQVFDLVDLQGLGPKEAAHLIGANPATVRTHLLRARRKLRAWLLEGGSGTEEEVT